MTELHVYACPADHRFAVTIRVDDVICGRCDQTATFQYIGSTNQGEHEDLATARHRACLMEFEREKVN